MKAIILLIIISLFPDVIFAQTAGDTVSCKRSGLVIVGRASGQGIEDIRTKASSKHKQLYRIAIVDKGVEKGALRCNLLVTESCTADSFRYFIMPVIDMDESWISTELRNEDDFYFCFKLYKRLARIHATRLANSIRLLGDPCCHKKEIDQSILEENTKLREDAKVFWGNIWSPKEFKAWEDKIIGQESLLELN